MRVCRRFFMAANAASGLISKPGMKIVPKHYSPFGRELNIVKIKLCIFLKSLNRQQIGF